MIINDFFLIVPLLMAVSIALVYVAVRRVEFPLLPITLIASAVLSMPIAYGAIKLAVVPGTLYWVYLAVLVTLGAALLTAVNHLLLLRQRREQEDFQAEVETAYAEEFSETAEVAEEVEDKNDAPLTPPEVETMESLFEFATASKERGDVENAIVAYQKILRNFGDDEYAPFVAIDLSNLFKEQAGYADAIATCEYALSLPAVHRSATMSKEFSKNLEYLKVVQEVLTKHDALKTPFSEIPADILAEIDAIK